MSLQFIRTDNNQKIEYSPQRLRSYQKILELWHDSDSAIALTRVVNGINSGDQQSIPYEDCEDVIKSLHKTGIISLIITKSGIFSGKGEIFVNDQAFFDNIFYKNTTTDVLHVADLKLLETKLVNNQTVETVKDIEIPKNIFRKIFGCC